MVTSNKFANSKNSSKHNISVFYIVNSINFKKFVKSRCHKCIWLGKMPETYLIFGRNRTEEDGTLLVFLVTLHFFFNLEDGWILCMIALVDDLVLLLVDRGTFSRVTVIFWKSWTNSLPFMRFSWTLSTLLIDDLGLSTFFSIIDCKEKDTIRLDPIHKPKWWARITHQDEVAIFVEANLSLRQKLWSSDELNLRLTLVKIARVTYLRTNSE